MKQTGSDVWKEGSRFVFSLLQKQLVLNQHRGGRKVGAAGCSPSCGQDGSRGWMVCLNLGSTVFSWVPLEAWQRLQGCNRTPG